MTLKPCLPILLAVVALFANSLDSARSQEPEEVLLWPGDAPHAGGQEAADRPRLRVYQVDADQPTPAIVILPGGGYGNLALGHEGQEIAAFFNRLGITAAGHHAQITRGHFSQ